MSSLPTGPEKRKYDRDWYHANAEDQRQKMRARYAARKAKDPRGQMLAAARFRAKRDGLPYALSTEDVLVPPVCPALGIPLVPGIGEKHDGSPTLDKLIPALGYVPGNVRVISWRANRIKCDATLEELTALVAYMKGEHLAS